MAKLIGVKTLDMQNGEITRIEHGGTVYSAVPSHSGGRVGDIAMPLDGVLDIDKGGFYEVNSNDTSVEFKDNVNYQRSRGSQTVKLFRKVAVSQPFAEMLTAQIDAVERRVTALEVGKQPEKLTPGDLVLISGRSKYGVDTDGMIGKLERIDADGDHSVVFGGRREYLFRREQLTKVAGTVEVAKPKTGDIVVITGNSAYSENNVGDIGIIRKMGQVSARAEVKVPGGPSGSIWTELNEMRIATPAEIAEYENAVANAAVTAIFAKAGRKPNEYRKGDLVRYIGKSSMKGSIAEVERDTDGYDVRITMNRVSTEKFLDVEIVCFAEDRADLAKGDA